MFVNQLMGEHIRVYLNNRICHSNKKKRTIDVCNIMVNYVEGKIIMLSEID